MFAGIGFGHRSQAELAVQCAASALDFWCIAQHLIDVADHAIGFRPANCRPAMM